MREIKFRGVRDTESGGMEIVYGDLTHDEPGSTAYFGTHPYRISWSVGTAHHNAPIRKGTAMQFTGLKDKNGVEIFEGDIVTCMKETWRDKNLYTADVRWQQNVARFAFVIRYDGEDGELFYDCLQVMSVEVIGNLYENPELLEAQS